MNTSAVDQLSAHLRRPRRPDPARDPRRASPEGEATVNELAEPFPISVQAVSKHLKVLERAGLIDARPHRAAAAVAAARARR